MGTRNVPIFVIAVVWATLVWAQDLSFSAKVDKTTVDVGEPVSLTVTLSGDVAGVTLPALGFPEEFSVAARSQSTNLSIRAGVSERSTSLLYVLIPQRAGTYRLGPFAISHDGREVQTEPIDITVNKPAVPPQLAPQGGRFTL